MTTTTTTTTTISLISDNDYNTIIYNLSNVLADCVDLCATALAIRSVGYYLKAYPNLLADQRQLFSILSYSLQCIERNENDRKILNQIMSFI